MHIQIRFATRTDTITESGIVHGGAREITPVFLKRPRRSGLHDPGTAEMKSRERKRRIRQLNQLTSHCFSILFDYLFELLY